MVLFEVDRVAQIITERLEDDTANVIVGSVVSVYCVRW